MHILYVNLYNMHIHVRKHLQGLIKRREIMHCKSMILYMGRNMKEHFFFLQIRMIFPLPGNYIFPCLKFAYIILKCSNVRVSYCLISIF